MIINYRSIELPLQSKWVWVNGRRTPAQEFGKLLFDAFFDKAKEVRLKAQKIWLYDSQFRVVRTELTLSPNLFMGDVYVCREDGRLGNIHFFVPVTTKEVEDTRATILARELLKVAQKTGGSIQTQDGRNPFVTTKSVVEPTGEFIFSSAVNDSAAKKDFIFIDILTEKASERFRNMKAIKIPPINYKPKDVASRYDVAKKLPFARAHINKVGEVERKETQAKAERERKRKAYWDWYNSLSPEERKKVDNDAIADWEAKNRPYRND